MVPENPRHPYMKHRIGGWLPKHPDHFLQWLHGVVATVREAKKAGKLAKEHTSIKNFRELIVSNTQVRMYFSLMFEEIPNNEVYQTDPTGKRAIKDWEELLATMNLLLEQAPGWLYNTEGQKGLVGFPFNAILDWPMGTAAGVSAFLREDVCACFKDILNEYGQFLSSERSGHVLNSDNWFSPQALQEMSRVASEGYGKTLSFEQAYECNPSLPGYGYKTWDEFFIRKFRKGIRPVYQVGDDLQIVNCCESTPYALQYDVKLVDNFWLKGQPYSLQDMLGSNEYGNIFQGGIVYQAFLSALSYHCWHAPVSGVVRDVFYIPGSYYAGSYWEGFANIDPITGQPDPDPAGPNESQGYICQVATRAVMLLEATDPHIGLMAIVQVGMAEVSSCQWTVEKGDTLTKGQDIGMFHFGGSTHCLIFRKGVELKWVKDPMVTGEDKNLPVCGALAQVIAGPAK
ncbi:phosphatidylserine decarboxylase [Lindgomyces ingoldianus]|uniref:Phosphatidylserine decarboxylase n=1 Tax=Lindgomyces ingoldianus TaxID=673940 RepID=A0ACB6RBI0_9PLEO|nr:phosphatidylserine decarboxylase [Lindgomyces ingoldianus]KAF2476674.1 phosphatidylserine decarboxylase [Lindgomyces ingoldianus]